MLSKYLYAYLKPISIYFLLDYFGQLLARITIFNTFVMHIIITQNIFTKIYKQ